MNAFEKKEIINETPEEVFSFISDPTNAPDYIKDIVKIEILTSNDISTGTRYRETRKIGKRQASAVIEVSHYKPPREVAFTSKLTGMKITYYYHTEAHEEGSELTLTCSIESRGVMRLFNGIMKKMLLRQDGDHLNEVKKVIEAKEI
ncbi:SRPBCC family protein [Alteribacillus sp. HJP-4]|uniref:SRPBCC family protein n=1 Tax=Alteribacillus sp. HJP-4 TaxID=2775394 RepID=UPI0035CD04BC